MRMFDDEFLRRGFFRSMQWDEAKKNSAFMHKRGLRDAIREYLHVECGMPDDQDEATEIEKTVGRVELSIRSQWGQKAARTRAKKKELKERELIRRAEVAIEKFVTLKSPLLFGQQLTVQHKPINPNKPRRKVA